MFVDHVMIEIMIAVMGLILILLVSVVLALAWANHQLLRKIDDLMFDTQTTNDHLCGRAPLCRGRVPM